MMLDVDIIKWYKQQNQGGFICRCGFKALIYCNIESHILKFHNVTQKTLNGNSLPEFPQETEVFEEEEKDPDED